MSVLLSLLVIALIPVAIVLLCYPEIIFILFGLLADASYKRREDGRFSGWQRVGQVAVWCTVLGVAGWFIYLIATDV